MISSGTRGYELVCWWWRVTHSSLPSEREFWVPAGATPHSPCCSFCQHPELQTPHRPLLPPRSHSTAHKWCSCAHAKGERAYGQAEVFSMEGLVRGERQWPWQDIATLPLVAGHSSRGTIGVRGSRVASISSVWITENLVLLVGRQWKFKTCPSLFSYCDRDDNGQDLVQEF